MYIIPLLRLVRGSLSVSLLMSMSEAFSVPFLYFNKTLLYKSSWMIKPGPFLGANSTSFDVSYQNQIPYNYSVKVTDSRD